MNRLRTPLLLLTLILACALFGCSIVSDPSVAPEETQLPVSTPALVEEDVSAVTPVPIEPETPQPTETPTPSPVPTDTPTPEPEGLIGWSEGGFVPREEMRQTETEYVSDKLHFTVTKVFDKDTYSRAITYFVTDLYIRDLHCLRTYPAKEFTTKDQKQFKYVHKIAETANALWAMTGDYCGHHLHSLIIRNGTVYDLKLYSDWDLLFLYEDGTMESMTVDAFSADTMREDVWQAWQFGPSLLDEAGHAKTDFSKSKIKTWNPRSLIGYVEPGHYLFVTVDGRQGKYSGGVTLAEAAQLMESLGCKLAFNLDGGESAELYWNGTTFNSPSDGGRVLSDIIYLIDEDAN